MRPDGDELPGVIRRALVEYVAPEVSSVYGRTQLAYALNLLAQLARESDGAAARLMEEIGALRALLREAARLLEGTDADAALVVGLRSAASTPRRPDLRLSSLRAERSRLYEAFTGLQDACVGASAESAAGAVYRRTIDFLRARLETQTPMR